MRVRPTKKYIEEYRDHHTSYWDDRQTEEYMDDQPSYWDEQTEDYTMDSEEEFHQPTPDNLQAVEEEVRLTFKQFLEIYKHGDYQARDLAYQQYLQYMMPLLQHELQVLQQERQAREQAKAS